MQKRNRSGSAAEPLPVRNLSQPHGGGAGCSRRGANERGGGVQPPCHPLPRLQLRRVMQTRLTPPPPTQLPPTPPLPWLAPYLPGSDYGGFPARATPRACGGGGGWTYSHGGVIGNVASQSNHWCAPAAVQTQAEMRDVANIRVSIGSIQTNNIKATEMCL